MFRQGDLLIKKINKLPKKLKKRDSDIILEGEVTGHSHRILNGTIYERGWVGPGSLFIEAKENTQIIHEEHQSIEIPAGIYEVIRQREYDPHAPRWIED
jgi:hypothetical protein